MLGRVRVCGRVSVGDSVPVSCGEVRSVGVRVVLDVSRGDVWEQCGTAVGVVLGPMQCWVCVCGGLSVVDGVAVSAGYVQRAGSWCVYELQRGAVWVECWPDDGELQWPVRRGQVWGNVRADVAAVYRKLQ